MRDATVKTVYLAGKITGDEGYRKKFARAAKKLGEAGCVVVSPAVLPDGFAYEAYMRMTSAMLDECDAVCMLPDWVDSHGARYEYGRATAMGKPIFMFVDFAQAARCKR